MIWKSLGFQLTAVISFVVLVVLLAPLPHHGEPQIPPAYAPSQPQETAPARTGSVETQDNAPLDEDDGVTVVQSRVGDEPVWSGGPMHEARVNAEQHWRKHGADFPDVHNEREYVDRAHDFVEHPPPGAEMKRDRRGDTLIYDRASNTFAVRAANGAPRTMFLPRSGSAYWDRQD